MNKKMKFVSIAAAMAMAASMGVSAFAAGANPTDPNLGGAETLENGTEVWAGVAVDNPDMRIKVTVPTLFAFVVNGSVDSVTHDNTAISAENGGLLLPNVKVENVQDDGSAGKTYDLTTTGDGNLTFENYSTYYDVDGTNYKGLAVKLNGSITNEAGSTWVHQTTAPQTTKGADVKKYQLSVNSTAFDTVNADGSHGMATPIDLNAPANVENGNQDTTTKLALEPSRLAAEFGVKVGGTRTDYNKAENSAKIGTIIWKVSTQRTVPGA